MYTNQLSSRRNQCEYACREGEENCQNTTAERRGECGEEDEENAKIEEGGGRTRCNDESIYHSQKENVIFRVEEI